MNNNPDNSKLVEAMKQLKAVQTVIFKEEFNKTVVDSVFYVPVSVEKDGKGNNKNGKWCVAQTKDNKTYLCVYTSLDELKKSYGSRNDIMMSLLDFVSVRSLVTKENSGLDGFVIDDKGENVAVLKEEMLPKK